jgi:predicted tellurium resistance membrane protein TerC
LAENLIALLALSAMEIVLGIDNIVFIAILTTKVPKAQQAAARQTGLALAMVTRIGLLFALTWILGLDEPFFRFTQLGLPWAEQWLEQHHHVNGVSWKDLILLAGGLFLIGKATFEIHEKLEGHAEEQSSKAKAVAGFVAVVVQIALLDIVFSIDSVVTAIGMVNNPSANLWVMILAIVLAVGVMLIFAGRVSAFIEKHPTLKMLALSFLILIGVMLVAEAIGTPIDKGYIYFAMGFALAVEFLNLRIRSLRHKPAEHEASSQEGDRPPRPATSEGEP